MSAAPPDPPPSPRAIGRDDVLPWLGVTVLCLLGFVVAYFAVEPAPPARLRIATGHVDGVYHALATRYAEYMAAEGVTLELVPSAGSVENMARVQRGQVELAFAQGGVPPEVADGGEAPLAMPQSVASVGVEPLWVFSREPIDHDLNALRGKRVACGEPGSGTRALFEQVLADSGIGPLALERVPFGGQRAVEALAASQVEAAVFVSAAAGAQVEALGAEGRFALLSLKHRDALLARHPFLVGVRAPRGVFDLQNDLPPADVELVAAPTTVLCSPELHPALLTLSLMAIHAVAPPSTGILGETVREFPGAEHLELPLADGARHFYNSGPSFLYRWLPFWVANLVDRLKVMLIPLLTLLLPLSKVFPPLWRWRIRSRIYRWYSTLHEYDARSRDVADAEGREAIAAGLRRLEREVLAAVKVPPSYMGELYHLRLHIWLLLQRLKAYQPPDPGPPPAP